MYGGLCDLLEQKDSRSWSLYCPSLVTLELSPRYLCKYREVYGLTVRTAVLVAPLVAEMVVVRALPTFLPETVKLAEVARAGTVTVAGTVAAEVLLLESVTTSPPAGAAPVRVTVPVDVPFEFMVEGFRVSPFT